MPKAYYIGRPNIGNKARFRERVDLIFERHWLTNDGVYVQELEARLADLMNVDHCVVMSNGTIALELAIRAMELKNEVIVPSMTFIATAHALQWQQIKPVFADIDSQSYNICPSSVESLITDSTTGIIGVHLYGRPCATDALAALADKYSLKLIYDAAHAFAVSNAGAMVGSFGDCEVFSFHATKVFNTFEGGAVTTNNAELAKKLRLMRNFGFDGEDSVSYIGTNGKMSEINAAMGLTNLESLDEFIGVNRLNYKAYEDGLSDTPGISLISYDQTEKNNYQYVIIEIDESRYGMTRDALKELLTGEGVAARRYFYPGCHRSEPYRSLYPNLGGSLPNTESFSERMLALPTGTQLDPQEVAMICDLIEQNSS